MNYKEFTDEYIEAVTKGFGRKVEMTCSVDPLKSHALICKEIERSTKDMTFNRFINLIRKQLSESLSIPIETLIVADGIGYPHSQFRHMWE